MSAQYFIADNGKSVGPFGLDEVVAEIRKRGTSACHVFREGLSGWVRPAEIAEVQEKLGAASQLVTPPIPTIDLEPVAFEIGGEECQYLSVRLKPGQSIVAESGAMLSMEEGIAMDTVATHRREGNPDLLDQALRVGKRYLTGESLFLCVFENTSAKDASVSFAAPFMGTIREINLEKQGGEFLCQKSSYLVSSRSVDLDIAFQKDLGAALFGGEGFILQRLSGKGQAFIHAGGALMTRELAKGEKFRVDTGCIVGFSPTVNYTVEMQKGIKNAVFGGEGLFLAMLEGPGTVLTQSMPFSRLARRILMGAVGTQKGREEGSVLGPLGTLLRGDIRF